MPPRLLITAGPTHEPIDAVRFIGNRSSGKMGLALADEAARRGMHVTLLLGPVPAAPTNPAIRLRRFRTCEDLRTLLREEVPQADILVMAAAVADYRPKVDPQFFGGKFRRKNENLTLELEPTPDLLAEVAKSRRPNQLMVGFALEPREDLLASAHAKLERKKIDMVVANPLETMDSDTIEAIVLSKVPPQNRHGHAAQESQVQETRTPGLLTKPQAAAWIMDQIQRATSEPRQ